MPVGSAVAVDCLQYFARKPGNFLCTCFNIHRRPFLGPKTEHVYPATSNMVEATDRFGSVLTLRLVRQGDGATTGSVMNGMPSKMVPTTSAGLNSSILYPQDGNRASKTEGRGAPILAHMTRHKEMHDTAADKGLGGSTGSPAHGRVRTSGSSGRISGRTQSRGGYGNSSQIAPVGTVGAGARVVALKEGNKNSTSPGLKLLGGLADEAEGDLLEVRQSVVATRKQVARAQVLGVYLRSK